MKKNSNIFLVLLVLMIPIWAFTIEPQLITVKHYRIKNENLAGIRILWASDFHIKTKDEPRLKRIIKRINKQNADIVVLGGDFVNGLELSNNLPLDKIMLNIKNIKAHYGVFAILGNHDNWYDSYAVRNELNKVKISVLQNENKKVFINGKTFYIAGVEDFMTGEPDIDKALANIKKSVVLFTHNPDVFPNVPDYVDLTIAGHTHGGQVVFPFLGAPIVPSNYGQKYAYGLKKENNKIMIVSRGLGTSAIHARWNCLPEIVIIDFE